jgi:hypothetical protein
MWSETERDRLRKLGEMYAAALDRSNGNKLEAAAKMKEWLPRFRDYDGLDPERLVKRVEECRRSGARLSLDSDELKPGGGGQFMTTTGRRW